MRISKVLTKGGGGVVVEFEEFDGGDDFDSVTKRRVKTTAVDVIHRDFREAFEALIPIARRICCLPEEWASGDLVVTGVTFAYDEETASEGASILCQARLPTSEFAFCFTTPRLVFDNSEKSINSTPPLAGCFDAINALCSEAQEFMAGKRAQGDLFRDL